MQATQHHPSDNFIYTAQGDNTVIHNSTQTTKFSDLTSIIEGQELSEMKKIWQEAAMSELRLNLMSTLKGKNVGFREVENFSLGLKWSFLIEQKIREELN